MKNKNPSWVSAPKQKQKQKNPRNILKNNFVLDIEEIAEHLE